MAHSFGMGRTCGTLLRPTSAVYGVNNIIDHAGKTVAYVDHWASSYGLADVYVAKVLPAGDTTLQAFNLSMTAPPFGYLKAARIDEKDQIVKAKLLRGELNWHHAYSAGTVSHYITPCVPR